MPDFAHVTNIFLLIVVIMLIRPHLHRWRKRLRDQWKTLKQRRWRPATPHNCALCCNQVDLQVIKQQ